MAYKVGNDYACSVCGAIYDDPIKADVCRDNHDMIYIQITKTELNRLVNFIFNKDEKLLTEGLIRKLQKYARNAARETHD